MGVPLNGWFIEKIPWKIGWWLGVPLWLWKPPYVLVNQRLPTQGSYRNVTFVLLIGTASGERVEKAKNRRASQVHNVAILRCFPWVFLRVKRWKTDAGCLQRISKHGTSSSGMGLPCYFMYFLFHSKMDRTKHNSKIGSVTIMAHNSVKPPREFRASPLRSFLGSKHGGLQTCLGESPRPSTVSIAIHQWSIQESGWITIDLQLGLIRGISILWDL